MPLTHPPGEAQVGFGHVLVKMDGVLRKICFFVMALTPEETRRLLQTAPEHLRLLCAAAMVTGLRAGELRSLTRGHHGESG